MDVDVLMHSSIMNKNLILPVMERSVYIIGKEQVRVNQKPCTVVITLTAFPQKSHLSFLFLITAEEVEHLLVTLDTNKSSGPDGISAKNAKICRPQYVSRLFPS